MSPSEVIIEVYIMPEDASFGALFFFPFKDLFVTGGDVVISPPPCRPSLEQQAWQYRPAPPCCSHGTKGT